MIKMVFLVFLVAGAISGTMAGLLGIGGGLLFVPLMSQLLPRVGIPSDIVMHVAVATSLMVIVVTSMSSTWAHHRQGGIHWPTVKCIIPGIIVGAVVGTLIADQLPSHALQKFFGVFAFLIAIKLLLDWQVNPSDQHRKLPKKYGLTVFGVLQGCLCALLGMGGGAISVPFFRMFHVPMRKAVSMSSILGLPTALTAAVVAIFTGLNEPGMPAWSSGYIYWPAFIGLMPTAVVCAPLGARLAYHLHTTVLSRFFAVFLLIVAIDMWIR